MSNRLITSKRTVIGFGSPHKSNTYEAHGSPLGKDEARATKQNLGWPLEPTFLVPDEVRRYTRRVTQVWCAFFALNALVALLLALVTSLPTWSLYTNVLNVPLLVMLFAGEYFYRRWRFPGQRHISPWELALRIIASPREYLGERA